MVEEMIPGAQDPNNPWVMVPPTTIMVPEEVFMPSFDSFFRNATQLQVGKYLIELLFMIHEVQVL